METTSRDDIGGSANGGAGLVPRRCVRLGWRQTGNDLPTRATAFPGLSFCRPTQATHDGVGATTTIGKTAKRKEKEKVADRALR